MGFAVSGRKAKPLEIPGRFSGRLMCGMAAPRGILSHEGHEAHKAHEDHDTPNINTPGSIRALRALRVIRVDVTDQADCTEGVLGPE
jgi:hypothetical protein